MYNVKFPLFYFAFNFLFFFFPGNQFYHFWKLFSVNKESRPCLLVMAASPRHSGTSSAWIHTYTCTNTIANTHTGIHVSNEEIITTTKRIPCCPFSVFIKSNILDLKSCTYALFGVFFFFFNYRKAVFTVIHKGVPLFMCVCETAKRIYSILKVTSHQEPFALFELHATLQGPRLLFRCAVAWWSPQSFSL